MIEFVVPKNAVTLIEFVILPALKAISSLGQCNSTTADVLMRWSDYNCDLIASNDLGAADIKPHAGIKLYQILRRASQDFSRIRFKVLFKIVFADGPANRCRLLEL